ncbi:uncharacterized protein FFC1_02771 [Fusarium fujikuroi]|nr:uncharacterized protein FFC1_02771 [Fusarium fujikuroi]
MESSSSSLIMIYPRRNGIAIQTFNSWRIPKPETTASRSRTGQTWRSASKSGVFRNRHCNFVQSGEMEEDLKIRIDERFTLRRRSKPNVR